MRAIRELSLAPSLVLVGLALFFGGGPADGSIPWLGGGALLAILALLASRGAPGGFLAVLPLGLLAVWSAISISWSWLPDRSWDYANRTAVYALFAALGLWAAARTRELVLGFAVLLGAVIVWSLLGKVLPPVYDYGGPDVTRLRGPIGLWNQLALASDFALVIALALRRRLGALLAYAALVALLLTYSRGGLATALLVVAVWLVFADDRVESAVCLVAAAVPAAVVVAVAFALPGITSDAQSLHVRWRDGLVFGAFLVAGAGAAAAVEQVGRLRDPRLLRRVGVTVAASVVVAGVVLVAVHGFGSGTPGNTGSRFVSTSSNFRLTWWEQAWHGFRDQPLVGTGAGSFHLLNLRFRKVYLDFTIEPHNLPLQVLAELGIIGLVLLLAACALLLRPSLGRRGHELALALLLPAFLVHSLVDVDWDFAAVAVPAFVAAGALAGRAPLRRISPFGLLPLAGVALLLAAALFSPWLARRYSNDAYAAPSARAVTLADRAHALDPFLVDPYWVKALAAIDRGRRQEAFGEYLAAVRRQPKNPQTWLYTGEYAKSVGCWFLAWKYLERYTELDPNARSTSGADDYREALRRVNRGQYTC